MEFFYYSLIFYIFNIFLKKSSLQKIINFSDQNYSKLIGYINSCIHAKIVYILSLLFLLNIIDFSIWVHCLDIIRGYCFYDTILILYHNPYDYQMLIHHILFFIGSYNNYIYIYPLKMAFGLLSEISNQFLYFGWFLIKKNLHNTLLFKINSVILLILFFVFRVLNFSYFLFFISQYCDSYEFFMALPITLLNYYWFYLLFSKFLT
tara:strand:- start:638 stop:1255 length:618 start_codon:yes stop_codon:yes gene_type:complete